MCDVYKNLAEHRVKIIKSTVEREENGKNRSYL